MAEGGGGQVILLLFAFKEWDIARDGYYKLIMGSGNYYAYDLAVADFDGDGDADLAVSQYGYSSYKGRVIVYFQTSPGVFGKEIYFVGGDGGDNFGQPLAHGDLDNDGISELVVAAPRADGINDTDANVGEIWVINVDDPAVCGATNGTQFTLDIGDGSSIPSWAFAIVGDKGIWQYVDNATSWSIKPVGSWSTEWGKDVVAVRDMDGDGEKDVVIGSYHSRLYDPNGDTKRDSGAVAVVYSQKISWGSYFALYNVQDVQDGTQDAVVIYAPPDSRDYIELTEVYLFSSNSTSRVWVFNPIATHPYKGWRGRLWFYEWSPSDWGSAGRPEGRKLISEDVDQDGYPDFDPGDDFNSPLIIKIFLHVSGATTMFDHFYDVDAMLLSAGDFDSDGKTEMLIGASNEPYDVEDTSWTPPEIDNTGLIVYVDDPDPYAAASALGPRMTRQDFASYSTQFTLVPEYSYESFTGDFNTPTIDLDGDGLLDFLLTAPRHHGPDGTRPFAGAAYIIYGKNFASGWGSSGTVYRRALGRGRDYDGDSINDFDELQGFVVHGWRPSDYLGNEKYHNSGIETGDFSGDGIPELVVGVPSFDGVNQTATNAGAVFFIELVPSAPENLTAVEVNPTNITISWSLSNPLRDGFKIYRSEDNSTWTLIATVGKDVFSYTDTGVREAAVFYYRVTSYNELNDAYNGNFVKQKSSGVLKVVTPPISPDSLSMSSRNTTSVQITWNDNSANETGYEVYYSTDGVNFSKIATLSSGATSYAHTGLTEGRTYYYKVRAYKKDGTDISYSQWSDTIPITVLPLPPQSVSASREGQNIKVSWQDASSNEKGYVVMRSLDNSTWTQVASVGADVESFLDTTVSEATEYYYLVKAWAGFGAGSSYAESSPSYLNGTVISAPNNPSILAIDFFYNGTRNIEIQVNDTSSAEDGFEVWRMEENAASWELVANLSSFSGTGSFNWTDADLPEGKIFHYKVRSFVVDGADRIHSVYSNEVVQATSPFEVTNLTVSQGDGITIQLNWTCPSVGEDGFKVYRSLDNSTWSLLAVLGEDTGSYLDSSTSESTEYFYYVVSFLDGEESSPAYAGPVWSRPYPISSFEVSSVNGTQQLELSWVRGSSKTDYARVYRKSEAGSNYTLVYEGNALSFTDSSLNEGEKYFYCISSYCATGNIESEPVFSSGIVAPAAPSNLSGEPVSGTVIHLNWTDVSLHEDGYVVRRFYANGTFVKEFNLASNLTEFYDTGLSESTSYIYSLACQRGGVYSNWVNITVSTLPNAPSDLAAHPIYYYNGTSYLHAVNLTWFDLSDTEDSFIIFRSLDNGTTWDNFTVPGTPGVGSRSYIDDNFTYGYSPLVRITYKIASVKGSSVSKVSREVNVITKPDPPSFAVSASSSTLQVNITYSGAPIDEFRIYRSTTPGGPYIQSGAVPWEEGKTFYVFKDYPLTELVTYYVKVTAYHVESGEFPVEFISPENATLPLDAPRWLSITALNSTEGGSYVKLSWEDPVGSVGPHEKGYLVQVKNSTEGWDNVTFVNATSGVPSYSSDYFVVFDKVYKFRVKAVHSSDPSLDSDFSASWDFAVPSPPELSEVLTSSYPECPYMQKIKLEWEIKSPLAERMRIERFDGNAWEELGVFEIKGASLKYEDSVLRSYREKKYRYKAVILSGYGESPAVETGNIVVSPFVSEQVKGEPVVQLKTRINPLRGERTAISMRTGEPAPYEFYILSPDGVVLFKQLGSFEGEKIISWDGKTSSGDFAIPGVYTVLIKISNKVYKRRVIVEWK